MVCFFYTADGHLDVQQFEAVGVEGTAAGFVVAAFPVLGSIPDLSGLVAIHTELVFAAFAAAVVALIFGQKEFAAL